MTTTDSFGAFKQHVREEVERALGDHFCRYGDTEVKRLAEYATLGGGRRWRAMATMAAGRVFEGDTDRICLPGACGVELAHAASLILDDRPSMDDAKVRRGKPCAHLVFSPWAVDMAASFLINMAYDVSLQNRHAPHRCRVDAALALARAGSDMFEGQEMDFLNVPNRDDESRLLTCYRLKSGVLYAAAARIGGILCNAGNDDVTALDACGLNLGMSYQFLDDVADVVAEVDRLGKDSGMDANKCTAVDLFGVDNAKRRAGEFEQRALAAIEHFGPGADLLRHLIRQADSAAM